MSRADLAASADPAGQGAAPVRSFALAWIALLALLHALLWSVLTPAWQTPDEPKHFEYVRLLAEGEGLTAFASEAEAGDPELQRWIVRDMDAQRFWFYGHAPGYDPERPAAEQTFRQLWLFGSHTAFYRSSPAYYALAALIQPDDRRLGLYAARFLGALLFALSVLFIGWASRELFPEDPLLRYGAPIFAALHPMAAFLAAGVNNDALANLAAAFAFLILARLLSRGPHPARVLVLLIALALALTIKRTTAYLIPTALVAGLAWFSLVKLQSRRPGPWVAFGLGLISLVALGWGGLGWLRAEGLSRLPEPARNLALRYLLNEPDQLDRLATNLGAPEIAAVLAGHAAGMLKDFWGSFGWQLLRFPGPFYALTSLLTLLVVGGALRRLGPSAAAAERAGILACLAGLILATGSALLFFAAYLDQPYAPPPQGRYLFVALGPAAILFCAGLGAWLPQARRPQATCWLIVAMLGYDLLAIFGLALPYFYR